MIKTHLLFGSFTTVHSDYNMSGLQFLGQIPERFLGGLPFNNLSFVEFGGSRGRIRINLRLILLFYVFGLEVERKVFLFAVCDCGHVELVNVGLKSPFMQTWKATSE